MFRSSDGVLNTRFFSFGRTAMVDLSTQILSEDSFDMCLGGDIWTFSTLCGMKVWCHIGEGKSWLS